MSTNLDGQTVVVLGGSAGIGLATARLAKAEGADVVLVGRNQERLEQAAADVGAKSTAALDATVFGALDGFFADLDTPVDHVVVTAGGPYYAPLPEFDFDKARASLQAHMFLVIHLAQLALKAIRPGGTLTHFGGTGERASYGGFVGGAMSSLPSLTAGLASEVAPVRVNVILAGFVDTPLSSRLLGDQLDARREELRKTLPIRRVVQPEDVAALAVHVMENDAITGATLPIDGGQQLL